MDCVEDFYNMPPALRRKLFSNVERFRLEQIRLAQFDNSQNQSHHHHQNLPRTLTSSSNSSRPSFASDSTSASSPSRYRQDFAYTRPRSQSNKRKVLFLNGAGKSARKLRKSKPADVPCFVTQAESEWFRSLPPKVQQLHFSPDEQARLAGTWCRPTSIILDSADKALYRLGGHHRRGSVASISSTPTLNSDTSTMASSNHVADSAIGMDDLYDSFRWLDEEDDLDLDLYDYHNHITDSSKDHTRRPPRDFRHTFSFASLQQSGRSTPTDVGTQTLKKAPTSRPSLSTISRHNGSFSRSLSSTAVFKHGSQPSDVTPDQPAQYYQDPEARLKLRVYLASPQKFDEAVEFGFPSLEPAHSNNENQTPPPPPPPPSCPSTSDGKWRTTGDSSSIFESDSKAVRTDNQRKSSLNPKQSVDFTTSQSKSQPTVIRPSRLSQHLSGGREMTLKMTLTRADLRTAESDSDRTSGVSEREREDPLRLADLPPVGEQRPVWDELEESSGVMKKMWSKLKRRH